MKKINTVLAILLLMISGSAAQSWKNYSPQNTNLGLPDNNAERLAVDAGGNLWIGTYFSGLVKFDGTTWTNFNKYNSPLSDNTVEDLEFRGANDLWICTYASGIYNYNGTQWKQYIPDNSGIPTNYTYSVGFDNGGNVWVGLYPFNSQNAGVAKFDGANWTSYQFTNGYNYFGVEAIAKDKSGNMWFGTQIGVYKFDGSNFTVYTNENTSGGLGSSYVAAIAVDPSGNMWFGTKGGGVSKLSGSTWTNYNSTNSPLQNDYVSVIAFKGNDIWIGTGYCGQYSGNGLFKFDGANWTRYFMDTNTFGASCVNDIVVDNNGNLWFGSVDGITIYGTVTGIEELCTDELPSSFMLYQNYPNPFNPGTTIKFAIPNAETLRATSLQTKLVVCDMLGREVAVLADQEMYPGLYSVRFNGNNLASGIYVVKLEAGNFNSNIKMLLLK